MLRGGTERYTLPVLFIWILAYPNCLCVNIWIRTACRKDSVGVPTHGSCCVALSPWDTFLVFDTWQGLGTLLQGRILLGRHCIYERPESSLLQCKAAAPVCAKNQRERLIWHVEVRPKRYACATAPTKCVPGGWIAKCFGQQDLRGCTIRDCGLGLQEENLLGSQAQLCLRTSSYHSFNPAFAASHGKQVPTLLAFVFQ